ncbi:hypothetical protein HYPSUDRAFT_198581 [Hypholoma sublateritium FD-334 SS-4]|uniref:Short-chain dehydrogenase/reductase SDR n=1 Tax=Hypholoma sublateritium (strain FD-334 SS-4) TaxID=945553 RepID=A0A0D2P743_HYPSF|nr:hypothetical protein HYPSUDRAFT_198581 [Hypholoma sublateritium FD-334 SS-4]
MTTLQNKTILIIGGSSGIGFAVARAALQALAHTVIIASSNAGRVDGAATRLQAHALPGTVRGEVVEAKDASALKELAARVGAVDHVVWTSGDVPAPEEGMGDFFAVRFWGPAILAQSVKINAGGSFTLTGGISDLKPQPGVSVPAGGCGAVDGLSKGLAVDLAPAGVRVNLVSPGVIDTEIWEKFPPQVTELMKKGLDRLLIKRFGEPDEVAEAYIFLMKCGYITGQRINVDGGITLA